MHSELIARLEAATGQIVREPKDHIAPVCPFETLIARIAALRAGGDA